ncbi:hypothetical protein HDU78_007622 [Chytriomyces hyalinus]|nr:hypothetical protein HDU78_007622 [Chytriomyces hyalinus]
MKTAASNHPNFLDTDAASSGAFNSFEMRVRKHFHQLTTGCLQPSVCDFSLCASSKKARTRPRPLASQAAAIMAVQLASGPTDKGFCPRIDFSTANLSAKNPFLDSLLASAPYAAKSLVRSTSDAAIVSNASSKPLALKSNLASATPISSSAKEDSDSKTASIVSIQEAVPLADTVSKSNSIMSIGFQALSKFMGVSTTGGGVNGASSTESPGNAARAQNFAEFQSSAPTASASLNHPRAKSMTNLPSLGSVGEPLPTFPASLAAVAQGYTAGSSQGGSAAASPRPRSPSHNSAASKVRHLEKTSSSTSSLFEEMDVETLSNHLTLSILETASARIQANPAASDSPSAMSKETLSLLKTVKTVFSSAEAVNASFLAPGLNSSSNDLGIQLDDLRKSFELISNMEPKERFQHTLLSSLEMLVSSIHLNMKRYNSGDPKMLRVFVVLLENPFLADVEQHGRILSKTCLVLASLRSKSRAIVSKWLSGYDESNFKRLINPFSQYLSDHFFPLQRPDETLISSIRVLAIFYAANEVARPCCIVPLAHFYNDTIAKRLNFKDEYRIWQKSLEATDATKKSADAATTTPAKAPQPHFTYFTYPFLFDPVSKTRILHLDAMTQMCLEYEEAVVHQAIVIHAQRFLQEDARSVANLEANLKRSTNPYFVLEIRRAHLVKDVLDQIHACPASDLKKPLKVKFVGGGEEGMDQGGVQKEFFQVLIAMLMDPVVGMFVYDPETRMSWLNGCSLEPLRQFELVGIVLGLALYNGVILGVNFVPLVYKKLLMEEPGLDDVVRGFPALGKGLEMLLGWNDGDVEDVFMRSFEIEYDFYGQVRTFELVAGGKDVPVTNANRKEYVDLYIKHYVGESVKRQFDAFRTGFHRVCGGPALKMCRPDELELLICGTNELDFKELEAGARYDDGYDAEHPVILNFWKLAHAMSQDRKKQLLMFVTASDRVPLKGLGNLTFVIQRNGPDTDRLPTALTCFGRLLLPEYETIEKLENRLVTAVENAKGFGLV